MVGLLARERHHPHTGGMRSWFRALGETRPLVVTFQLSPLKSSVIETPVSDSAAIDRAALAARSQLRYETAVVLVRP